MSRISGGEQIEVRATNNIYTVLVASAVVVEIVALVILCMTYNTLYKAMPWG